MAQTGIDPLDSLQTEAKTSVVQSPCLPLNPKTAITTLYKGYGMNTKEGSQKARLKLVYDKNQVCCTLKPKVALRAAAEPKTISTAVTIGFRCLALGPRSRSEAVLLLLLLWPLMACSAAECIASRSLLTATQDKSA